jgi:hypothetical protein
MWNWPSAHDHHVKRTRRLPAINPRSTSNFVEHPQLIAERITRYAELVGRENVIAETDCGFSTFARAQPSVHPSVTWAKFQAMAEGARLASEQLWPRAESWRRC